MSSGSGTDDEQDAEETEGGERGDTCTATGTGVATPAEIGEVVSTSIAIGMGSATAVAWIAGKEPGSTSGCASGISRATSSEEEEESEAG
jgi:hypothetical protein